MVVKLGIKLDESQWSIKGNGIGQHSSGLVINRNKIKDNCYSVRLWNVKEWETFMNQNKYLQSEIGVIKLGLIYQYIGLINKKEKTFNDYIIPEREEIRADIKINREREDRLFRKNITVTRD